MVIEYNFEMPIDMSKVFVGDKSNIKHLLFNGLRDHILNGEFFENLSKMVDKTEDRIDLCSVTNIDADAILKYFRFENTQPEIEKSGSIWVCHLKCFILWDEICNKFIGRTIDI